MFGPDLDQHSGGAQETEGRWPSRPLPAGTEIDRWVLIGPIREEPDHVLYAATLGAGGPPACLKLLDADPLHDAAYFRHLRRDCRRWQRISTPHLARLLDAGRSDPGPYLATALFAGPSLAEELRGGALPPAKAARLGTEVASALDAALAEDLLPGPVSPADVTITASGALVTDLGLARGGPDALPADPEVVHYVSPEEARGEEPRPESTVYSLACLMHTCLTGLPPYEGELPPTVLYAHVAEPPPRPSELYDALPAAVDAVFERAMAKRPEERHPSPGEFARDLAAALGETAGATPARAVEAPAAPARTRRVPGDTRRLRGLAALAAAVLVAALAGWVLGSAGDDGDETPAPRPAPGPSESAVAAQGVVDALGERRARLRRRLAAAERRAGQDRVALELAALYDSTADGADGATPAVVDALRAAQLGYERLASDAGSEPALRRRWDTARAAVRRAEADLSRALAESGG